MKVGKTLRWEEQVVQEYFDLNKQIVHLAIHKSVMFELAEKMLHDSNYRNFVSCSKIKYAELIGDSLVYV